MFGSTNDWYKIWKKTDLCLQKWNEKFGKFSQADETAIWISKNMEKAKCSSRP